MKIICGAGAMNSVPVLKKRVSVLGCSFLEIKYFSYLPYVSHKMLAIANRFLFVTIYVHIIPKICIYLKCVRTISA